MKSTKKQPADLTHEVDRIKKQVRTLGSDINSLFRVLKKRYTTLDPKTKKKVRAGVASLGAVLAATALYKSTRRSKK